MSTKKSEVPKKVKPTLTEDLTNKSSLGEVVDTGTAGESNVNVTTNDSELPPLESEEQGPAQEVVREKVIIKEKSKGGGSFIKTPGCGCKSCSCYGCLMFILIIVMSVSILLFKPSFVWNPIKSFLNASENPPEVVSVSVSTVEEDVKESLENGESIEVTEAQLQSVLAENFDSDNIHVDIEPNYLKLYTNVDSDEKPLWFFIEISQDTKKNITISKIGLGRIGAPEAVRDFVADRAFEALNVSTNGDGDDGANLMSEVFKSDENGFSIDKVRFDKDKITLSN